MYDGKRNVSSRSNSWNHITTALAGALNQSKLSWSRAKVDEFLAPTALILVELIKEWMEGEVTPAGVDYFQIVGRVLTGNGLLLESNISKARFHFRDQKNISSLAAVIETGTRAQVDGVLIDSAFLIELKETGNRLARRGLFDQAIPYYSVVGDLAIGRTMIDARSNNALMRLKLSNDWDLVLLYQVVIDCTFVLELEPNHQKCLYRRGLALAKLKNFWSEAVADFERCIELDPDSPAKEQIGNARQYV